VPDLEYIALDDELYAYVNAHHSGHDPLLDELHRETAALGSVISMQISADEGALMTLLCRAIGARRAIEVGTFTGYSSLCIARGLPEDGHLLCCDISPDWTAIARRYWERAGLAHKIELRLGAALSTLRALPPDPVVDLSFIDADKSNYGAYYEEILLRTRPGGLVLLDNVLWSGRVIVPADQDEDTVALRRVNDMIAADRRVDSVMLPIRDGLTIVRKR
jgi:caffeoyl-CoA O-methyltransferase